MADTFVARSLILANILPDNITRIGAPQGMRNWLVSAAFGTRAYAVKSTAGPYVLTMDDGIIEVTHASNYVITLFSAATALCAGKPFTVNKRNSNLYTVTINRAGSDTIQTGETSVVLTGTDVSVTVYPDGNGPNGHWSLA